MSLVLNVEILGEFKNLTAATKGAEGSLKNLQGTAASISSKMTTALAAIGLGFSLHSVTTQLVASAKAAIDDAKSQDLLAIAMRNTGKATDDHVTAAKALITAMSLEYGVADDDLRPAFQKLFVATHDVTESNKLLTIALNASTATGKDLDTVAQAMAKSLAGNDAALVKLIPSLKNSKTPIDDLGIAFAGSALKAANVDPYLRMNVIFGEMQEAIGTSLMPILLKFSAWLASPEGKDKIQGIIDLVTGMIGKFTEVVGFVTDNKETILGWGGAIVGVGVAISGVNSAVNIFTGLKTAMELTGAAMTKVFIATGVEASVAAGRVAALGASFGWITLVVAGLTAIVELNKQLGLGTTAGAAKTWATTPTGGATNFSGMSSIKAPNTASFTNMAPIATTKPVVVNNISIKGQQSAEDIAKVINRSTKVNGTTVFRGTL